MFPDALHDAVRTALAAAHEAGDLPDLSGLDFVIERPRDRAHGDWATNAAMVAARPAKAAPRVIAQAIVDHFPDVDHVASLEIAGPGFVNVTLDPSWYREVLRAAALGGPDHARGEPTGTRIQVEFVSSNPNGPLHIGHARGGVIGDVLCRLFEYAGHEVQREYYYNDAGVQMDRFAESLEARYRQALGQDVPFPEEG
ncbi:MAG: arginine--tRNA ligase, partial [Acidimicrobiia bacterium]|nr:arginine--tRNA ligase [Acidimicrobiia bacterium]